MAAHVMVHIMPEDLPSEGIKISYRLGECFEKEIEWGEISQGLLIPEEFSNDLNESGISIHELGMPGYAGFEARTGTYWRYRHDSDPDVFREQCMQIIEIMEPFSPRSSWESWELRTQQINPKNIRVTYKNRITAAELSYKIVDKGFGYQIKDLSNGLRVQKLLKHDYMLNQMLGTSFKKLNHHNIRIETAPLIDGDDAVAMAITFLDEQIMLKYRITNFDFTLGLLDISDSKLELLKLVEIPHSSIIDDSGSFMRQPDLSLDALP
jgi:hypothetical protein